MSIRITHISKRFGKQEVLRDIGFEIRPGEIVGFLGRNGAGKSTCLKIITGGLNPDTGTVEINGHSLFNEPLKARRLMGYLPETNPLYGEMNARFYLQYVAGIYKLGNPEERVDEMLALFNLQAEADKPIRTLSKGNRQRVGLAQALIHNPEVLILDEPFSGLDPMQLAEMHQLIKTIGQDKAILFSSHSLPEAGDLCTRLLILHEGVLKADAAVSQLTTCDTLENVFKQLTR